jgi:serine/threonine-protein kinase HipA
VAEIRALAAVHLWGHFAGGVAESDDGVVTFEYDPEFARTGLEISPLKLPLAVRGPVTFPELARIASFQGLPGVLADALPDRFGNAVIRAYFEQRGRPEAALSPVQRLLYIGGRAMGALEFRPPTGVSRAAERESLEVADLVAQARRIVEGSTDVAVPEIMRVGASAGGLRPKAVILWNRAAGVVRSAFAPPRPGDEPWIVKFDGVGEPDAPDPMPRPFGRIEYAYAVMARAAGLDVPETHLLRERRLAHFMVRRFDRTPDHGRLHLHTLGGMQHADYDAPGTFSYEQLLRTVLALGLGYPALEEAFRRMVFNVAAVNQDDHVKNVAFLMTPEGRWSLAPAYDLTFARGHGFTRYHQMTIAGTREGITRADLLAVGARFSIRKDGAEVIERVASALDRWPAAAREAGVPKKLVSEIGALHRRLV